MSNPKKLPVRRNLFPECTGNAPLSSAESAEEDNYLNAEMELIEQEYLNKQAKWNFDFKTETPLEGDWEWEKVEPAPEVQPAEPGELQRIHEEMGRVQSAEEENHSL